MASCTCVPPPCGPGWVGAPVGPNASVDRPRPSRAIGGEQRLGCDTGWKGLPEGGVRGRTLRLGRTALLFAGARGVTVFTVQGRHEDG